MKNTSFKVISSIAVIAFTVMFWLHYVHRITDHEFVGGGLTLFVIVLLWLMWGED